MKAENLDDVHAFPGNRLPAPGADKCCLNIAGYRSGLLDRRHGDPVGV